MRAAMRMTARIPPQPPSLTTAIADRLRQQILQGTWQPDMAMQDREIATRLGVNRLPVREAMKLLCHEGWLTAHPVHGMTVARLSPAQIQEAQALLQLLHNHLAQHAAVQGGLAQQMYTMARQRLQLASLQAIPPAVNEVAATAQTATH